MTKPKIEELGVITVTTAGVRDTVALTKTGLVLFTATCRRGKQSTFDVKREILTLDDDEAMKVYITYMRWKRTKVPGIEFEGRQFPRGHKRDGTPHPWGPAVGRRLKPPEGSMPPK